jgi:hypothetical protein
MILNTFAQSFPHVQLWYFLPAHKRGPFNTILIGSNEVIELDYDHINRQFAENKAAFRSLVPYGLTSAEALLPHYVADENAIREVVASAPINSLDHPRYEFFYPWDYDIAKQQKVVDGHRFLLDLKRKAYPDFLASLESKIRETGKLKQTFAAEFRYLAGFQKFLQGIPLTEQYRIFDEALSLAPWNDSLRARIYAQYKYIALTQRDPSERAYLMRRANSLYENRAGQ